MSGVPFHILGSSTPMPAAARILYVDGSAPASTFRPGVDLELSHWVPTSTPFRYWADTSTEICMRFIGDPLDDDFGLAVNSHVDVDGILSVFCLAHPDVALAHRDVIVGAAEMGDLSAGVGWEAFRLAQELTVLMGGFRGPGRDPLETYTEAFARIPGILGDDHPAPDLVRRGWEILEGQAAMVAAGDLVEVEEVGPRLVLYAQVEALGVGDAQHRIAPFNALIDESIWLWPHVRNRAHPEAYHLVSTADGGWTYDLWLPGYVWAHTPNRWRPAILEGTDDSNVWRIRTEMLAEAVAALQDGDERGRGRWALADEINPFESLPGRAFPVVLSFVDDEGQPAVSSQSPDTVLAHLAPVLADG